jgi:cytochrome c oxidase assembly protein subunit 15
LFLPRDGRFQARDPEPAVSETTPFRIASRLGLTTAGTMFCLIVVGSIVRTTGSGLACPDWPLCHGRLIPPLQFNVLIEWFHRLLALCVSLLLAATAGWTFAHRATRARLGGLAVVMIVLLAVQVVLGALTVWKLLDPSVVGGHLAVALLLFASIVTFTLICDRESAPAHSLPARPAGVLPLLAATTLLTYVQCVLGGMVSTQHAGTVCPDWPTCNGEWFPPLTGLIGVHMIHRFGAYTLTALMLVSAIRLRSVNDDAARMAGPPLLSLTVGQVVLGVSNVVLGTPWWLSAAHLALASAILALVLTVTFRIATLPAAGRALAAAAR